MGKLPKLAAALLTAGLLAAPAMTSAATPSKSSDSGGCFFVSQWKTWSALDDNTILLRLNNDTIYQVGVSGGANQLKHVGTYLQSVSHGNSICSHLDLQLSAADTSIGSFKVPLIAKSLVKLTPEQVAAIPKKDLPSR